MNTHRLFQYTLFTLFSLGCVADVIAQTHHYFNSGAFKGLRTLSNDYSNLVFEQALEKKDGSQITLNNCKQAHAVKEDDIASSELTFVYLLKVNCYAANIFLTSTAARKTFFPLSLSKELIDSFPTDLAPNLRGKQFNNASRATIESHTDNYTISNYTRQNTSSALLKELEFIYTIMARADIDNDAIEDVIIRIEWYERNTQTNGYKIVILKKTSPKGPVSIETAYTQRLISSSHTYRNESILK